MDDQLELPHKRKNESDDENCSHKKVRQTPNVLNVDQVRKLEPKGSILDYSLLTPEERGMYLALFKMKLNKYQKIIPNLVMPRQGATLYELEIHCRRAEKELERTYNRSLV